MCGSDRTLPFVLAHLSALLEAAITPRTRAIMPVPQMGLPCDMQAIMQIARRYQLPVVEDAACAIGSELRLGESPWERIGNPHGDIACFSLHPRKLISTGDGGMLTYRSAVWDRQVRMLRVVWDVRFRYRA